MNAASAQGQGTGYNEEFANEPLTPAERQNNRNVKEPVKKNPKGLFSFWDFF